MNFQNPGGSNLLIILAVTFYILLSASSQILIKNGLTQVKEDSLSDSSNLAFFQNNLLHFLTNKWIVVGAVFFVISTLSWFIAVANMQISILSPLGSLVFVVTALFAGFFLSEHIPLSRWIGIGFVIAGVYLITQM